MQDFFLAKDAQGVPQGVPLAVVEEAARPLRQLLDYLGTESATLVDLWEGGRDAGAAKLVLPLTPVHHGVAQVPRHAPLTHPHAPARTAPLSPHGRCIYDAGAVAPLGRGGQAVEGEACEACAGPPPPTPVTSPVTAERACESRVPQLLACWLALGATST